MSKMHLTKFQNRQAFRSQRLLIFDIGVLKLRDLATLWFFKNYDGIELKNQLSRHFSYVFTIASPK